jgi:aspartate racemase
MPNHIGIVACSAEGAALCYRTICAEGARLLGAHAHPEVSMHSHSLSEYVDCLDRGDLQGLGELMLSSANKLASIRADFLICPDNTIHQAFSYVEPRSPRPWLTLPTQLHAPARPGCTALGDTRRIGHRRDATRVPSRMPTPNAGADSSPLLLRVGRKAINPTIA